MENNNNNAFDELFIAMILFFGALYLVFIVTCGPW